MTSSAAAPLPSPSISLQDWIGFGGMTVGMFMAVLDIQIVASSLSEIQAGLSATQDEITWIQTSYLIAEIIMIPLSGWLARALSTRYLYFFSCLGFTTLSLACAFSWNLASMTFFRAWQGFFGGALIPTVFSLIYSRFPKELHTPLSIFVGLIVTIAPTAGPVLGGYLTDNYSWHVLFLINLLPGIGVCFTTWKYVHVDQPEFELLKQIDFRGILSLALFLGTLQYVLEEGSKDGWFDSTPILFLAIFAGVSGIFLLYHELTTPHPIVDLRAFSNKNFTIGCLYSFVIGSGLYGMVYLLPVYLSAIKDLNSQQIGYYVAITGLFQILSAPIAGTVAKKMDIRLMMLIGFSCFGLGAYLNRYITFDSGFEQFFWPQAIRGFSLMFCFVPISNLALGALPKSQLKNASGLYNLMRNLGGAIGLAFFNTQLTYRAKVHYAHLREHISGSHFPEPLMPVLDNPRLSDPLLASTKMLYGLVEREAWILSFIDVFTYVSVPFFIGLMMLPFIQKVEPAPISEAH